MADSATLTEDGFLGGRVTLLQPAKGYRAGVDPVLLAAGVPALSGQSVLELGCGVGAAVLCLMRRVPDLDATGLEVQPEIAELARRNADRNLLPLAVITGDVARVPVELRQRRFDHVIANPPYFHRSRGSASAGPRERAMGEDVPLAAWLDAAIRRLAPRGRLTVIQKADRAPELLAACDGRLGDLRLLPVVSRAGGPADRVLLRARMGARGAFRLLSPLVLHPGDRHLSDGDGYLPGIEAVLREMAPLPVDWDGTGLGN